MTHQPSVQVRVVRGVRLLLRLSPGLLVLHQDAHRALLRLTGLAARKRRQPCNTDDQHQKRRWANWQSHRPERPRRAPHAHAMAAAAASSQRGCPQQPQRQGGCLRGCAPRSVCEALRCCCCPRPRRREPAAARRETRPFAATERKVRKGQQRAHESVTYVCAWGVRFDTGRGRLLRRVTRMVTARHITTHQVRQAQNE